MSNKHSTLAELFASIADSIRAKTDKTESMVADDFPDEIENIYAFKDAVPQSITVTPSVSEQTFAADTENGYDYIDQVIVEAIPYVETENSTGGITVTIG